MTLPFIIVALLTIAGALGAMNFRNLVHCALSLAVAFSGFAMLYLQLGAEFVGFAQVLVYLGAIAILIVFAILLTRGGISNLQGVFSPSWIIGATIAVVVVGFLSFCVAKSEFIGQTAPTKPDLTVETIGQELMTRFVLPLEMIGVLLTATVIGAVVIALAEKRSLKSGPQDHPANQS